MPPAGFLTALSRIIVDRQGLRTWLAPPYGGAESYGYREIGAVLSREQMGKRSAGRQLKQEKATLLVLQQAEVLCRDWTA